MSDTGNKAGREQQLSKSDRDMGDSAHPSDQRSPDHISPGNSGEAGREYDREALRRSASGIHRETGGGGTAEGMAGNDSVDAAVELSERGGIRPERKDPATHTDRSRDRKVKE
jgi:hypothetical protein